MAISYNSGTVLSTSVNTDRHVIDMENEIFMLDPTAAPFSIFLNKIGKEKATNKEVNCLEYRTKEYVLYGGTTAFTGAVTSILMKTAATGGDTATYLQVDDVLYNTDTSEHMLVTAIATTGTATVTRGIGASDAATGGTSLSGVKYFVLADAQAEASNKRSSLRPKMATVSNYMQIIETLASTSKSELAIQHYGGDPRKFLQKSMGIEHQIKKERSFIYGDKSSSTGSVRTMQGIKSFISSNTKDFSSTTANFTKQTLGRSLLEPAFKHNSSMRKIALCGSYVLDAMQSWPTAKLELDQNINFYGLPIVNQRSAYGELVVAYHRQLLPGEIIILDLKYVKEAYLRSLKLNLNVQTPGADVVDDQYIEECTLRVKLEECHAYGYNVIS